VGRYRRSAELGNGIGADQLGPRDPTAGRGRADGEHGPRQAVRVPDVQGPGVRARDGGTVSQGRETKQPVAVPGHGRAQAVRLRQREGPVRRRAEHPVRLFPPLPGARAAVRPTGRRARLHRRGGRVERRLRVRRTHGGRSPVPGHERAAPASVGRAPAGVPGMGPGRRDPVDGGHASVRPVRQADGVGSVRPRVFRRAQTTGRPPLAAAVRRLRWRRCR